MSDATPSIPPTEPGSRAAFDADEVAANLDGVELALARLDAGTYWTCETSGAPLPDELLRDDPTLRRLPLP
jgi:RNA polymerase-binding transcription factor DksA